MYISNKNAIKEVESIICNLYSKVYEIGSKVCKVKNRYVKNSWVYSTVTHIKRLEGVL